jgi:hypothetical protein
VSEPTQVFDRTQGPTEVPEGPLWISYTEHLDDYEGTEREAAPPPPYRSHHYTVAC